MDCASRDWQICQNYKQSAIIFIRKYWMSSGHDSSALSLKALDQRMLSGSCYFRLWALLWVGWRDLESDWILRADEPWKVQGVDVMPHSNCPGHFFSVPKYFCGGGAEDPDTAMRQQLGDKDETIWQNVGESHHGEMFSHLMNSRWINWEELSSFE